MPTLTLTLGMDTTVKIELADENGSLEALAGSMTASDFRITQRPSAATNVVKHTTGHSLLNGVVTIPMVANDLIPLSPGPYFGQWGGIVNGQSLVSQVFDVVVEPRIGT